MHAEIAQSKVLKLKARTAIKGLGLPKDIKQVVLNAIDAVTMPLAKYYKSDKATIKQAFITLVLGGASNINEKIKGEIEQCLMKKI